MSVTHHRKARERAQRESLILAHARRLLVRDGYQNLNLDELARAVEYSKGTLYLHFKTKEDLTLAVVTEALRERADLFERAMRFQGRTREQACAIGVACGEFAVTYREYFHIEMMLESHSFWDKASEKRRRLHGVQASRMFHAINSVVQDAIRQGDLPSGTRAQDVTHSLIAITVGSHITAAQPDLQLLCAIADPLRSLRTNQDRVCDGWSWRPLCGEWDYHATERRIRDEIFPHATWIKD